MIDIVPIIITTSYSIVCLVIITVHVVTLTMTCPYTYIYSCFDFELYETALLITIMTISNEVV